MDRAPDHQPLQRIGINVTHRLPGLEKRLAAWQLHFQKLVILRSPDLSDPAIGIDCAVGQFLKVIAVLNDHFLAADLLAVQHVNFNPRCDRPLAVVCRDKRT